MNTDTTEELPKVHFVYAVSAAKRKVTVAYIYDDSNMTIWLDWAECSRRDVFTKRVGRYVASGRLRAHGGIGLSYAQIGGCSYTTIADYIRNNINQIQKLSKNN